MKHLKILGLTGLATVALMAVAGTASATVLTSPAGTPYTGAVKAEIREQLVLHGLFEHVCNRSVIEGKVEQHGSSTTAAGQVTNFTISECGNTHIWVVKKGKLEFHTDTAVADGNGTVTLAGAEITYVMTTIFGSLHCTIEGVSVDLGTMTGSINNNGEPPEFPTGEMPDPTSAFCPPVVEWTGIYEFTSPDYIDVD